MLLFSLSILFFFNFFFFIVHIEILVGKICGPLRGNPGRAVWNQLNHISFFFFSSFGIFTYMIGMSYL